MGEGAAARARPQAAQALDPIRHRRRPPADRARARRPRPGQADRRGSRPRRGRGPQADARRGSRAVTTTSACATCRARTQPPTSPRALHFGTISPREVETLLLERSTKGAAAVRRQLAWRDFWLSVIRAFPDNRTTEHDERFRGMEWRDDPESLQAWKQGETGVPWIDAGMRQLRDQGWMHNRVRMAVASYLTKNLLIDWREGEAHFMENLIDGDESQNNGNWQWAASTGADPQPYFRIFNPVLQQEKFDADGAYVRRWVPELSRLPRRASGRAVGGAGGGPGGGRMRDRHRLPGAARRPQGIAGGGDLPLRGAARLSPRRPGDPSPSTAGTRGAYTHSNCSERRDQTLLGENHACHGNSPGRDAQHGRIRLRGSRPRVARRRG